MEPPVLLACWCFMGAALVVLSWRRSEKQRAEALVARELLAVERKLRLEERRGRTRAEASLRNLRKEGLRPSRPEAGAKNGALALVPIGVVRTPFPKRAGTPRQGSVCPRSRGLLQLSAKSSRKVTAAALEGLEDYGHAFLIFEFHANTDDPTRRAASKVQPPRGYGARVGWLATRSPHRANALGLSLVRLDRVDAPNLRVYLGALDLCDGTPVFDLKPYVPWDSVRDYRVPAWVSQDDAMRQVTWTPEARVAFLETHGRELVAAFAGGLYDDGDGDDGDNDDDDNNSNHDRDPEHQDRDSDHHPPPPPPPAPPQGETEETTTAPTKKAKDNKRPIPSGLKDAMLCVEDLLRQDPRSKRRRNQRPGGPHQHQQKTTSPQDQVTTQQDDGAFNIPFAAVEIFFHVDDRNLVVTITDVRPAPRNDDLLCLSASSSSS